MAKINYQDLLKQPMTRKQFLRNVGLLFIGIIGINNALKILSADHSRKVSDGSSPHGFGGGKYGA